MEKIEVEAFCLVTNAAVIRVPGRRFPGIVIQGDSMSIMWALVQEIARLSCECDNEELTDTIDELMGLVTGYLSVYERTLEDHNHPLPYETPLLP